VTYYGGEWRKANSLSATSNPPAAFKGLATKLAADPAPAGTLWSAPSGDSADLPATVPSYMAVIVSSRVAKSGSKVTGDVVRLAVVRTNADYVPGTARATGELVAMLP
jgi:hypothetical protein